MKDSENEEFQAASPINIKHSYTLKFIDLTDSD